MTIYQKLAQIQQEIKCPKDKENTFGGYKYRSAESILESLKPIMAAHKVTLILNDDIRMVGDRIYVMAEAKMIDLESETTMSTYAFARETLDRPKMDAAQITGSASSYARKYALNGMLLLDDVKDPDTDEYAKQGKPAKRQMSSVDFDDFTFRLMDANVNIKKLCGQYHVERIEDLTPEQVNRILEMLNGTGRNS
jgi:hypothetical protein